MLANLTPDQSDQLRLVLIIVVILILLGVIYWLWRDRKHTEAKIQAAVDNASNRALQEAFQTRGRIIEELRIESNDIAMRQEHIIAQFQKEAITAAATVSAMHKEEIKAGLADVIKEIKQKIDDVLPPTMENGDAGAKD